MFKAATLKTATLPKLLVNRPLKNSREDDVLKGRGFQPRRKVPKNQLRPLASVGDCFDSHTTTFINCYRGNPIASRSTVRI
jgi:hypothetical protein